MTLDRSRRSEEAADLIYERLSTRYSVLFREGFGVAAAARAAAPGGELLLGVLGEPFDAMTVPWVTTQVILIALGPVPSPGVVLD